jgi:hypothetical protein
VSKDRTEAPGTPEVIDADAARAARREGKKTAPILRFLGVDWVLPIELPAETAHAFGALAMGDTAQLGPGMEELFGNQWEKLKTTAKDAGDPLSFEDEVFILERVMDAYGVPLPESLASGSS